jgi:Cu-Zn family superoxide dismutase
MRPLVSHAGLLAVLATAGCGRDGQPRVDPDAPARAPVAAVDPRTAPSATAQLASVSGSGVEGTVRLADLGPGVRVTAQVSGLGEGDTFHAIQILATGSCGDLGEAPPHFDPDGAPHGPFAAPAGARHAGDLGNVRSYDGDGRYDRLDPLLALSGGRSAVGHALVIRAGRDDAYTLPDGAPGEVVACGVLEG